MDSAAESFSLQRLSADVLSEVFRYLSMAETFLALVAFPPRVRALMTHRSVKELYCLEDNTNYIRELTPKKHILRRPSLLTLPLSLASFRMLTTLHIISNNDSTRQLSVLRLTPQLLQSLSPTLKRLRLFQPSVMSLFFEQPPSHPPTNIKAEGPITWINIAATFPILESLILEEKFMSAFLPHHTTAGDCLSFITVLPRTLLELSAPVMFGCSAHALPLLPPNLATYTAYISSYICLEPTDRLKLSSETAMLLPSSLTNLILSGYRILEGSPTFLSTLSSLQSLTLDLPGTDDNITYPPNLRFLNVGFANERTFSSLKRLPKTTLETLIIRTTRSYPLLTGFHLTSLPLSLTSLDMSSDTFGSLEREELRSFPPNLRSLSWSGHAQEHFDILPNSLTFYRVYGRNTPPAHDSRHIWQELPHTLTSFETRCKLLISAETFRHPSLTSISLPEGSIEEDLIFAIPKRFKRLSVNSISGTGFHLQNHLTHVTRLEVKRSIDKALETSDVQLRYAKVEATELHHLGQNVETIENNLSIAPISPQRLPRVLKQIFMPYSFAPHEIFSLPPNLTAINATANLTSTQLNWLPRTLTTLKRVTITVDHSVDELKLLAGDVKHVRFPQIVPESIRKLFGKLCIVATWNFSHNSDHARILPENAEIVIFEQDEYSAWSAEAFKSLPAKSLVQLDILDAPLYNLFCSFCSDIPSKEILTKVHTSTFNVIDASGALQIPSKISQLTMNMGAFRHPQTLFSAVWPTSLTHLIWTQFIADTAMLSSIPPSVTKLEIKGQGLIRLTDQDMALLPRQLQSLKLDHVHLTKACLSGMPPNLTELSLPKAVFPATSILRVLSDRRKATSDSQYA